MTDSSEKKKKKKKDATKTRVIRCPSCKKSTRFDETNPHRPFCSELCKNEDIASWAEESYRVPGPPADPDELVEALRNRNDDSD